MPKVSVILPVFNSSNTLPVAIDSVLNQTLGDIELLVIDDGSTEDVSAIVQRYDDQRLRFLARPNKGLGATLNELIGLARGTYIARMDADDYSVPERLALQFEHLERNRDVVMVGGQIKFLVDDSVVSSFPMPEKHDEIRKGLLEGRFPICHPALMLRAAAVRDIGGYRVDGAGEDLDFFLRMTEHGLVENISETVLHYRVATDSLSMRKRDDLNQAYALALYNERMRSRGEREIDACDFEREVWKRRGLIKRAQLYCKGLSDILYRRSIIYRGRGRGGLSFVFLGLAGVFKPTVSFRRFVNHVLTRG